MQKKKIIVPKPLNITFEGSDAPPRKFYFAEFISYFIEGTEVFNKAAAGIRAGIRIDAAARATVPVKQLEDGTTVIDDNYDQEITMVLDQEDWQMLRDAIVTPQIPYPVKPAKNIIHWIDAVEEAKTIE